MCVLIVRISHTKTIDQETESLLVHSTPQVHISALGSSLPSKEPSYAILSWSHSFSTATSREISESSKWFHSTILSLYLAVFIYSCPSDSPVKLRMVYASGVRSTHAAMKNILVTSPFSMSSNFRRIETSDPNELNEEFLKVELGLVSQEPEALAAAFQEPKAFPKPKGPPRRR